MKRLILKTGPKGSIRYWMTTFDGKPHPFFDVGWSEHDRVNAETGIEAMRWALIQFGKLSTTRTNILLYEPIHLNGVVEALPPFVKNVPATRHELDIRIYAMLRHHSNRFGTSSFRVAKKNPLGVQVKILYRSWERVPEGM